LKGFFEPITAAFDWLFQQFQRIATEIGTFFTGPFIEFFKDIGEWFLDKLRVVFEFFTQDLLTFLATFGRITPEKGPTAATGGMMLAITGAGGLGVLTLAGQMARWWANLGLGPIAAMFADVANFKVITGAVVGAIASACFATPMRYYVNMITRPWLPDLKTMHEALGRGKIPDEMFIKHMGYFGFGDEWFTIYKALAARPVSAFIVRYLAEAEIIDPESLYEIFIDSGYSEEHARYLVAAMTFAATGSYRRGAEAQLYANLKDGFIRREAFRTEFDRIRDIHDPRVLVEIRADWDFYADKMKEILKMYENWLEDGVITEDIFRSDLTRLGMDPLRVEERRRIVMAKRRKRYF